MAEMIDPTAARPANRLAEEPTVEPPTPTPLTAEQPVPAASEDRFSSAPMRGVEPSGTTTAGPLTYSPEPTTGEASPSVRQEPTTAEFPEDFKAKTLEVTQPPAPDPAPPFVERSFPVEDAAPVPTETTTAGPAQVVEHATSGFVLANQPYQPAHPTEVPDQNPLIDDTINEQKRIEQVKRQRLDQASHMILAECREEVQEIFRGRTNTRNCSYVELLIGMVEMCCDDRQVLEQAERNMRFDVGAPNTKTCPVCGGEFRSPKIGQMYCCSSCGAKASGMSPVTAHHADCGLLGRAGLAA